MTSNERLKYFKNLSRGIQIFIGLCIFIPFASLSQEGVYKDLDDAFLNKDEVRILKLRGKKMTEVPIQLLEFENLETLSLKKNRIDSLPEWFSELPIRELNLAKNQFSHLPSEIFEMPLLEYLDLSENVIDTLYGDFRQMKSLKVLDLWGNLFEDIPIEMTELPQLVKMDVRLMEFNRFKQQEILEMFHDIEVYMSPPCNCK